MVASRTGFKPPHCPNPACVHHCSVTGWRYKRIGFFFRKSRPRRIQRFLCVNCGRSFSTQTFSTTYWLRKPLLSVLFHRTLSCSGYRQIARELGVSHTTVMKQTERLGRHCLLFSHLNRPHEIREPVVIDGFESFEFSQYHPCHFHVAVGAESHFFYAFTDSELRRKGRMTPYQKRRRRLLERSRGRPDPKSIEMEVGELVALLPGQRVLRIRSDEHRAYPRALRRMGGRVAGHEVTSSRKARTPRNPLFPVNLLELLLRHSQSNHKRETIAFSKRRQNAAEKIAVLQVWRNFVKQFSERRGGGTPAQRLGLRRQPMRVSDILSKRLFPSRTRLPDRLKIYYRRETVTRQIPRGRTHRAVYAF